MLNIVVGGTIVATMTIVFLYACLIAHYNRDRLMKFPYEAFGMVCNAVVGIVGFSFYMTYLPVLGQVGFSNIVFTAERCSENRTCDPLRENALINTFTLFSTVRFLCWYGEFVTSFCFIMVASKHSRCMTALRYLMHGLNVSFSVVTLVIVAGHNFPRDNIVGGPTVAPVVLQMLLLVWSLMSFWFIAQSSLYRSTCFEMRPFLVPRSCSSLYELFRERKKAGRGPVGLSAHEGEEERKATKLRGLCVCIPVEER